MKETRAFETLKGFHSAVNNCQTNLKESVQIDFIDGLSRAVKMVESVSAAGKKVMLVGNGGSAAIASHQAVDLWKNGGIRATAFNDPSLLTCLANDYSYADVFSKSIEMFGDSGDLLIAVSSSGKSQNILNAVESARKIGCSVVGFSGFNPDNPLRLCGDVNFYIPSRSYGIVEVGHLLIIHAIIDEVIATKGGGR